MTLTVSGLKENEYVVQAYYYGNDDYLGSNATSAFKVAKNNAPISISVSGSQAGEPVSINVTVPGDATGQVLLDIGGNHYYANVTDGVAKFDIVVADAGEYEVVATYAGDSKYLSNSTSAPLNLTKSSANMTVKVGSAVAGGDLEVKVTLPDDAEGNITVTAGNQTKTVEAHGGENTIVISNMTEGTQNVTTTYSGDGKYNSTTVTKTITVTTSIKANNMKRGWNSSYDYEAEFLDKNGRVLVNKSIKFVVNGKTYTVKTDNKGIARLTTSHLKVGKYNVTCINTRTGQNVTYNLTIVKRLVSNKNMVVDYKSGKSFSVRAIGDDGKPAGAGEFVAITVNGVTYAIKTDKNGYAKLKINLKPGKYKITAEYKNTKVSNKVTVKSTISLVKKTISIKNTASTFKIQAKLKWSNGKAISGKKVTIKFQGKSYNAKTNSKGIASVTISKSVISKLAKGKSYSFTASYVYESIKGTVKVSK
jgi:hypothetical protein